MGFTMKPIICTKMSFMVKPISRMNNDMKNKTSYLKLLSHTEEINIGDATVKMTFSNEPDPAP